MGRSPCCSKVGLQRGPWSTKEDAMLANYIQQHGEGQWRSLPKKAGLLRCGKSCRLRWMNYLRPGIKRGNISQDEEDLIVRLHGLLGNRWSLIAGRLPGRTDNEIKNYWNTHLLKKLKSAGINPIPHKDLPKPAKPSKKQPSTGSKKKKNKQQNKPANAQAPAEEANYNKSSSSNEGEQNNVDHHNSSSPRPPVKTKVYLPKPIRVFSRTSSYESLASGSSSSNEGEKVAPEDVMSYRVPPPIFEDSSYGVVGYEDDFLGAGCILPLLQHQQDDVNMWERVYDEYFQLL